jgi:hypothetical protein
VRESERYWMMSGVDEVRSRFTCVDRALDWTQARRSNTHTRRVHRRVIACAQDCARKYTHTHTQRCDSFDFEKVLKERKKMFVWLTIRKSNNSARTAVLSFLFIQIKTKRSHLIELNWKIGAQSTAFESKQIELSLRRYELYSGTHIEWEMKAKGKKDWERSWLGLGVDCRSLINGRCTRYQKKVRGIYPIPTLLIVFCTGCIVILFWWKDKTRQTKKEKKKKKTHK